MPSGERRGSGVHRFRVEATAAAVPRLSPGLDSEPARLGGMKQHDRDKGLLAGFGPEISISIGF